VRTLKLTVAYDGTNYVGWQRQLNGMSVQQQLEEAFAPLVGHTPTVVGAGRTDAGVHALAQVASINLESDLSPDTIQRALNIRLPYDIRVVAIEDAEPGFHAQFRARGKTYRYRMATAAVVLPFDRWFVWHAPGARDLASMRRAAAILLGTHDFASFQAAGSFIQDTVRTLSRLDVTERDGEIQFDVDGDGFLRHMVRTIVGTLADVGAGLRPPESMAEILAARDRRAAGRTAPAQGLTLVAVHYADSLPAGGLSIMA
jgi:tRNA pseudouridine38-40 synthase